MIMTTKNTIFDPLAQDRPYEEEDASATIDPRILRSSYVPSQLEVGWMRKAIEEERSEIRIQQWRSVISAIRRVPVEIWQTIFSILCGDGRRKHSFDARPGWCGCCEDSGILWILPDFYSAVCSHWRNIITDSPCLWSSIHIMIHPHLHPRIHIPLATHLRKSRNYPLKLQVSANTDLRYERDVIEPLTRNVLRVVFPHLWRCQSLDVQLLHLVGVFEDALSLENLLPFTFPHLTHLLLSMKLEVDPAHAFWKALTRAPRLKNVLIHHALDVHHLPYSQLTGLKILDVRDPMSLLPVLQVCKSLQGLCLARFLYLDEFISPKEFASPPVVLPSVRRLDMIIPSFPHGIYPLFGMFVFPSLRELVVKCYNNHDARGTKYHEMSLWPPLFLSTFQRSAYEIRHLTLRFHGLNHVDLEALDICSVLEMTPNVTHLEIALTGYYRCEDGLLINLLDDLLVLSPDSPVLLPKLSHLYIHDDSQWGHDPDLVESLLEVSESRSSLKLGERTDVAPLSAFHVVFCDNGDYCYQLKTRDHFGLVREHERQHGMRCRIAHATSGVNYADYQDKFDPEWWIELDEELC
ncbi:hypothetical protein L218DRAFT_677711 [Marasmius fiardii PR-910]|nr:hypothetical protein L218DRAFT_677711 [Marasmius fiardii PR-910]